MKKWETKNGTKIYRVLSGRCNIYLIIKGVDVILVDTGKISAFRSLCKRLDSINISIEKIPTLVLTHTHYDHCQSAKKIQDSSGCRVIVSEEASECIQQGFTKLPEGTMLFSRLLSKLGNNIGKSGFGYKPFKPDILVNGELTLHDWNGDIRIIKTAGHSNDSISIIIDSEVAVVGDLMFGIFKNSIFPPYANDIPKMLESWKTLLEKNCKIFLPGHGSVIHRNLLEKEFKKHMRKFTH